MRVRVHLLLCCLLTTSSISNATETWSGFQNGGQVELRNNQNPPTKWKYQDDVAWSVTLDGYGQSSPVVFENVIYMTYISGEKKDMCHVIAVDRQKGVTVWQHKANNPTPEGNTSYVSRAAPTPVCDADGVIAFFEGGIVVALDPTGEKRWERDLVADYGPVKARHGLASSLEQNDAHVFVWIERQDDPYVAALDKKTGQTVWKSEGLGVTSWSSPRLIPVGNGHHLVLSGIGKLLGIDPETGKHLWSYDDISGNSTPTPMPIGIGRFLIGATTGRGTSGGGKAAESNGVMEIKQDTAGEFSVDYVWRAKRATSSFGSPIASNGNAYFVNRSGVVYCLDLETGKELYTKRTGSSVWATPIAVDNRIYLFGKDGSTTVIKSGPKFEQIAMNRVWAETKPETDEPTKRPSFGGSVLYAAAVAGSDLILRRGDMLYRIGR